MLAIPTGMRRGELLGLKWDDVDLKRGVLQIKRSLNPKGRAFNQPKSAKGRRRIGLTSKAVEALKRHRAVQNEERLRRGSLWQDHGLVFPSQAGTPMNADNFVKRSFKPLLKRTGLPQIAFHDLRHTFASLMLLNRERPKVVQEMIGHTQISTTLDTYSYVLPDMQDEAVKRVGSLFS